MSRHSTPDPSRILDAAAQWRDRCLLEGGSILSDHQVWTAENLEGFKHHYVDRLDESSKSFMEKFEAQLAGAPPGVKRLAGEICWLYFLFAYGRPKKENKIREIQTVLSWAGDEIPSAHPMLDAFGKGIGDPGTAFQTLKWREFRFIWRFASEFKELPVREREELLADPWRFAVWVDGVKGGRRRQMRSILCYFFFPDSFERIASRRHKRMITEAFSELVADDAKRPFPDSASGITDMDWRILQIRQVLERQRGGDPIDFYETVGLRAQWDLPKVPKSKGASFNSPYAAPFNKLFDPATSDRVLDTFKRVVETVERHLTTPGPHYAITFPKRSPRRAIMPINLGSWRVFGYIRRPKGCLFQILLPADHSRANQEPYDDRINGVAYALTDVSEDEFVRDFEDLWPVCEKALQGACFYFSAFRRSQYARHHLPVLKDLVMNREERAAILAKGLEGAAQSDQAQGAGHGGNATGTPSGPGSQPPRVAEGHATPAPAAQVSDEGPSNSLAPDQLTVNPASGRITRQIMSTPRYSVNQHPIQTILTWIESEDIAIPEIQRPFVWNTTQVRDLLDSLFWGYPVGYLIAWRNPSVRLKDGRTSEGKRVLIDGQQRVTALMAAVLGRKVITKDYKNVRIRIAYHPIEARFEVANPAIAKDKAWIPDISVVFSDEFKAHRFATEYCAKNPKADIDSLYQSIDALKGITHNQLGLIELNADLDIETVTEIFIRINAKGAVLSQADFAMSKIAASEEYDGHVLRKTIDYFCHLAVAPEFYSTLAEHDTEFAKTPEFQRMTWLKNENDDLYDPSYTDMLRVAFTSQFNRGKLADLVALLSGRNFETKSYEQEIAAESFARLRTGLDAFMNETNFKRFMMILRSAGFIEPELFRSQNVINFAYVVYLVLREQKTPAAEIESLVRRWTVMSILTRRYASNPETAFDFDIRRLAEQGVAAHLERIEQADLSDAYWEFGLPQNLDTSVASSPFFKLFLAAQVHDKDKGFLSAKITITDLITHRGDVHHIFPRNYLKKLGFKRSRYNQIANFVYMQSEINIAIGDKPPVEYFSTLHAQCNGGDSVYGNLRTPETLEENLRMNCIPANTGNFTNNEFDEFLSARRHLMASKIQAYYQSL